MQEPEKSESYLITAMEKPSFLLRGDYPRLIDEWQMAPTLWDAVRTAVDDGGQPGMFILTGSNSVDQSKIHHTGTGRIARLKMFPMSLYESRESNGKISLMELFNNPNADIDGLTSDLDMERLIFAACRGGWPGALRLQSDQAQLLVAKDYFRSLCKSDIQHVDGVNRDEGLTRAIMRSYSRNIATLATKNSMVEDVKAYMENLSMPTFDDYVKALKSLFVIEDVDGWNPSIRSKTSIRSSPKRNLVDPSIAVAALGLSPSSLMLDLKTFGFLFECLCIRDLKAYSQKAHSEVGYYHDRYNLEADIVLHLDDGRYALIECKLGGREIDMGARHLLEIKSLVRQKNEGSKQIKLREPDLLIVLTGGEMAYTRPDGVKVVPIGCLKD